MKNKLLRILSIAALVISSEWQTACHKQTHGIVFLPQNSHSPRLSDANIRQVKDKLKDFDESLYFLEEFKGGKAVGKPLGAMPEILLVHPRQDVEAAADPDFDGYAIQIGCGLSGATNDFRSSGGSKKTYESKTVDRTMTPPPTMPHPHLSLNIEQSGDLVKAIDQLLPPPRASASGL
jgi:hypothetical protein